MFSPHFFLLLLNLAVSVPNPSSQAPEVTGKLPANLEVASQTSSYRQSRCRCWRGSGRREILTFEAGRLDTGKNAYLAAVSRFLDESELPSGF